MRQIVQNSLQELTAEDEKRLSEQGGLKLISLNPKYLTGADHSDCLILSQPVAGESDIYVASLLRNQTKECGADSGVLFKVA